MNASTPSRDINTSRDRLAGAAYADDKDLSARQRLYAWQVPTYDLPDIVARQIQDLEGTLVDIGCGNGRYVKTLRTRRPDLNVIGLDVSAGIMAGLTPPLVVADAMHLPFPAGQVDGILAMHMIYHLPDVEAGIAELTRVLREPGVMVASTNSREDKHELDQLWAAAAASVLGLSEGPHRVSLSSRFPLDEAPDLLARHFDSVEVIELPGVISVPEPEPVVAHLRSYRAWADQTGVPFDATINRVHQRLTDHLREAEGFTITCRSGILICRGARA